MATQTVQFCTREALDCGKFNGSSVILCVPSSLTVSGFSYIDATLIASTLLANCSNCTITYTFSYDDTQLLVPSTPLINTNIKGVVCNSCITSWVKDQIVAGDANFLVNAKYIPAAFKITANTSDAADTYSIDIAGGGDTGVSRGADLQLTGNENGALGGATLVTGNAAGNLRLGTSGAGIIRFDTNATARWYVDGTGQLTQDVTGGGNIVFNKATTGPFWTGVNGTLGTTTANAVGVATNGTTRWNWTSAGNFVPLAGGTYDIGAAATVVNNIFSSFLKAGTSSDLEIGTYSASGGLFLVSNSLRRWGLNSAGVLSQDATNGANISFTKTGTALEFTAIAGLVQTTGANALSLATNSLARWVVGTSGQLSNDSTNGGDLIFAKSTTGVQLQSGANGRTGTLTLNGATPVVVSNTSLAAGDMIILERDTIGGTPLFYTVSARTNGTSFSVTGTATDTSVLRYWLVKVN